MIDSIKAYSHLIRINKTKEEIIQRLQTYAKQSYQKGYTTYIDGDRRLPFKFVIDDRKVSISGSIWKFSMTNNLEVFHKQDVLRAIVRLEEITGLPIGIFILTRIDISENIVLEEPVNHYLRMFEGINKFKKETYKVRGKETGHYFIQTRKEIVLYDKFKEQQQRTKLFRNRIKGTLNTKPNDFNPIWSDYFGENGPNVLRYEFRVKSPVARQFGVSRMLLRDIVRKPVWKILVRSWFKHFLKLSWRNEITKIPTDVRNVKELKEMIFRFGVEYLGGTFTVLKMLEQASKDKQFGSSQQVYRLKKAIKQIERDFDISMCFDKVQYICLRQKIIERANYHLAS